MGKASSSKKVSRAAKAAGRPGAKKNYAWPLAIGGVVVLGVVLIVFSLGGSSNASPRIGEHWHAAYGVYDCDAYLSPQNDTQQDFSGIHTHGEGLMHMHPFSSNYTGDGANISAFAEMTGMEVSDDSFEASGVARKSGDDCGGEEGVVQLLTWDGPGDETATVVRKDIGDHAPKDGTVWVLAFAPEGAEIPKPDAVRNLADPLAAEENRQPPTQQTATTAAADPGTTVPGTSTTEAPADGAEGEGDTSTTTAAGDTPATTAPATTAPAEPSGTTTSAP